MALSYCTNWVAMDPLVPDMSLLQHQQEQEPDLVDLPINFNDDVLFNDINEYFSMDADSCAVLPPSDEHFTSFSDPSVLSLPHEPNPVPDPYDDVSFYHQQPYPKRSRSLDSLCHSSSLFGNVDDPFVQTIHGFTPDYLPRFVFPQSRVELGRPPVVEYRTGHNDGNDKKANGWLSAQSMAARERRKRISDKTQELGRLIPGGNKMNTAEMFQAAAHYVKFLHAQVGILGLMARPSQESSLPAEEELRLHRLLTSSSVQERLYRAERCIVPKWMVEDLGKDRAVRSHPSISRDLGRFVESTKDLKPPLTKKAS